MNNIVTLRNLQKRSPNKGDLTIDQVWRQKVDRDPFLNGCVFTLELLLGDGTRYFLSTKPLTVLDGTNVIIYRASILEDPKITTSYDFKGGSASQRSINISLDGRFIDPMKLILGGSFLAGVGELALNFEGGNYSDRYILIQGDMTGGIEFGANQEPIDITLGDARNSLDQIVPSSVTSKDGFPYLPDDQVGKRFPLAMTPVRYIPTIKLSGDNYGPTYLIVGGTQHNIQNIFMNGTEIPAVTTFGGGGFVSIAINWTQVSGQDELGNVWTGVEFVTQNTPAYKDASVYAGVIPKSGSGLTVMEIIEGLITDNTGLGTDGYDYVLHSRAVMRAGSALTAEVLINGSGEGNLATAFSYVEGAICKEFPMLKAVYTGRGYGIVYTDRSNRTNRLSLVRGQGLLLDRMGSIKETSTEDIFNSFTLRYNYNAMGDTYGSIITRNSDNSNLCRLSESRIGRREMSQMDCILITNDASADIVIEWFVNHYTLPSYEATYCATPKLFFLCQIGDNIELTDDRLGFNKTPATILSLELTAGKCEVRFQIWLQYQNII